MSLRAWEKQALDSIEDELAGSDPKLASLLATFQPHWQQARRCRNGRRSGRCSRTARVGACGARAAASCTGTLADYAWAGSGPGRWHCGLSCLSG